MTRMIRTRRQIISRSVALGGVLLASRHRSSLARSNSLAFSMPIGLPGEALGDGFLIRHGFAAENIWYLPGWLHTGEDYYLTDGDAAGAGVYAAADGEIVYTGSEYPGLVVIVRHDDDLYSMYGHLDHTLAAERGSVERGQLLGAVFNRTDGRAPSHLHFEMRTFLTAHEVNGDTPRYSVGCGFQCPPGPGYWPIDAPEHPSEMGWRNPTHVIARRAFSGEQPPADAEVVVARGSGSTAVLWSQPSDHAGAEQAGELQLNSGDRYRLLAIAAGKEDSHATSAEGYRLWYRIESPDAGRVWVQAAIPLTTDTGSDGRPSTIRFDFLPTVTAE